MKEAETIKASFGEYQKYRLDMKTSTARAYMSLYGRIKVHPLLNKIGKRHFVPKYIVDREEVWVIYKPPMWRMSGDPKSWQQTMKDKEKEFGHDTEVVLNWYRKCNEILVLQEWHGLNAGLKYLDGDCMVDDWGFIQRLDVETDGPVIVAKTWRAQRALKVQMHNHLFSKGYLCLVHGKVAEQGFVKAKFVSLGGDDDTQIWLPSDADNDPFFWERRPGETRMAETFYKPLAYYKRDEQQGQFTRYFTLVYVNILTGITHQVRITMQSIGHPLVSDDRYLPKAQALSDITWCPRNFLTEVRSDWFDMFEPYDDKKRRKYTRISIENPLPKLLQQVLEQQLTLVEEVDHDADLSVGAQYWAIGDEQLMAVNNHPEEFRRKVYRWGQRRGIQSVALDRLLLLEKGQINEQLDRWKKPSDPEERSWVCPRCMTANNAVEEVQGGAKTQALMCQGYHHLRECRTSRHMDEDAGIRPVKGYKDWLQDPTMNLLVRINSLWLEARKRVVLSGAGLGEKIQETEGTRPTVEHLEILEKALIQQIKKGEYGIMEEKLLEIKGLENITLPLGDPPKDSSVRRMRLPGSGVDSQWCYTLVGSVLRRYVDKLEIKPQKWNSPVPVKTFKIPDKMFAQFRATKEEKMAAMALKEAQERELKEKHEEEKTREEALRAEQVGNGEAVVEEESLPKGHNMHIAKAWRKVNSTSVQGGVYYFNDTTGASQIEMPKGFSNEDTVKAWKKIESKSKPDTFYWYNEETAAISTSKPADLQEKERLDREATVKRKAEEIAKEEIQTSWKRIKSSSKPGKYFYFNPKTGANEARPPIVDPPWILKESTSEIGQYYYFNEETSETMVDPPVDARPAPPEKRPKQAKSTVDSGLLPPDWIRKTSSSTGKSYYYNKRTFESRWEKPI